MYSTLKAFALLLFLLLSQVANAHIAGVTDTSVQIHASGLTLTYTVPADNLKELPLPPEAESKAIEAAILEGFRVLNDDLECQAIESITRSLSNIGSEQFEFKIDCLKPLNSLELGYELFFDIDNSHENFSRITILNRTQNFTFSAAKKSHTIEVGTLVLAWDAQRQSNRIPKKSTPSSSHYFPVGIEHIVFGFDHLLFLLALLLLPMRFRQLLALITTFTVAHSITLALSVLDIVTIPALYIEAAIAFSIVYVAVETTLTLRHPQYQRYNRSTWKHRLVLTFLFGLMHGFGFSYILKTMGLGEQVAQALLYFNIGVEAGQILAIALAYPILKFLFSRYKTLLWAQVTSVLIGLMALTWLLERLTAFL